MRYVALVALLLSAAFVPASSAYAATAQTTGTRAEVRLLAAPLLLKRLHPAFADGRANLVRRNTSARCKARGRPVGGGHVRFRCVVWRGHVRVGVLYLAKPRGGFEVRRLGP